MKKSLLIFIVILLPLMGFSQKKSWKERRLERKENNLAKVDSLLEAGTFKFNATSAIPVSMPSVELSSSYDVVIGKDSIISYLPYFGRAYSVDLTDTRGGIDFSEPILSSNEEMKDDTYFLELEAETEFDKYTFIFSISKSGYGSLMVNSYKRQPISFYGTISGIDSD